MGLFGFVIIADSREAQARMIHEKHKEWLRARGIEPAPAEAAGWETGRGHGTAWLRIPYLEGGEVVNVKSRLTSEKAHMMETGAPLLLYNADALDAATVKDGSYSLVITEGEFDAEVIRQAGYDEVVSVPNGAPSKKTEDIETAKRYEWVDRHADKLAQVRSFILAVDGDEAGSYLRADLAALLGPDRCKFVEYPEGCKDANEVLLKHGQQAVIAMLANAKDYPVKGLFRFSEFPDLGEVRAYPCGIPALEDYFQIVPGTLTVVTGPANHGKTSFLTICLATAMRTLGPVAIGSFETLVKPILFDTIMQAVLQTSKSGVASHPERNAAAHFVEQNCMVISNLVDDDLELDLDGLLELAQASVVRNNTKLLLIDPWNEISHKRRRDETESDYTGRALRKFKHFARANDVAVFLVAHPDKSAVTSKEPIDLYSISGSAHWANKADYGISYFRPDFSDNRAVLSVTKARMGLPGGKVNKEVAFDFDRYQLIELDPIHIDE